MRKPRIPSPKEAPTHLVTVDYQTANGNPATARVHVIADDHERATDLANAHVRTFKRFGRIQGGTVEEIRP